MCPFLGCTSVEIKGNLSGQLNIGCETHLHQHVHHVTSTCSGGDPAATKAVEGIVTCSRLKYTFDFSTDYVVNLLLP